MSVFFSFNILYINNFIMFNELSKFLNSSSKSRSLSINSNKLEDGFQMAYS